MSKQLRNTVCAGLALSLFGSAGVIAQGDKGHVRRDVASDQIEQMQVKPTAPPETTNTHSRSPYPYEDDYLEEEMESEYPDSRRQNRKR